jgi:hypothetical protein
MMQLFNGLATVIRSSSKKTNSALSKLPISQVSTPLEMKVIADNVK